MEIVVVCLFFGFLGAVVAQRRSGETGGGFLMGLLLGPIGVLIAALKKPDPTLVDRSRQREGLTKCAFCAEYIKAEAIVCRHCGRNVLRPVVRQ
jgi:hypothetical protein